MFSKITFIILTLISLSIEWCYKISFFEIAGKEINEIDWSPDGQYLVTASSSQRVTVYNANTSEVVWFDTLTGNVTTAKFSNNGKLLAVGQMGSDTVKVYNVPGFGVNTTIVTGHGSESIYEVDFNSLDTKLIACGTNAFISERVIADNSSYQKKQMRSGQTIWSCKYTDSDLVGIGCDSCSTGNDDYFLLSSTLTTSKWASKTFPKDIDWLPASTQYMFSGRSSDNKVYLFNSAGGSNGTIGSVYDTFVGNIWGVSVSKDSQLLAAGGVGGNLYILNISTVTANPLPLVSRHAAQTAVDVNTVRFSFDGNYIATGRADGVIDIYAKNCLQCPMTSYINGTTCRSCNVDMIGCSMCRNSTYCIACLLNYYVDTTTGPAGTQLCKLCDSLLDGCAICKSSSVCIKCDQNYYLNGNTCAKCSTLVADCDECRSNGTCIKCSFYTYLTSTANCDRCNLSITNCLRCS